MLCRREEAPAPTSRRGPLLIGAALVLALTAAMALFLVSRNSAQDPPPKKRNARLSAEGDRPAALGDDPEGRELDEFDRDDQRNARQRLQQAELARREARVRKVLPRPSGRAPTRRAPTAETLKRMKAASKRLADQRREQQRARREAVQRAIKRVAITVYVANW